MQKIDATSPEAKSADITAENIAKLKALFPEVFTEGKDGAAINVDVLKGLVGAVVTDADEKYGLNWHGKRRARQLALTPSTGTLRPCPEESIDCPPPPHPPPGHCSRRSGTCPRASGSCWRRRGC